MSNTNTTFKPTLGLLDATMIVMGSMIGSGIFIVSAGITREVGSPWYLMAVWGLTGLLTLTAALSYGELSAMFPKAGGQYVYLREAFGAFPAFLYGWAFFAVVQTGTIAAVGVAFSKFAAYLWPVLSEDNILLQFGWFKISVAQIVSIVLITFLTWVNTRGVKEAKWIQLLFTSAKLIALFGLIVAGFLFAGKSTAWADNWAITGLRPMTDGILGEPKMGMAILTAIAVASVGSIFSSDAWNNVTFIAGEIKNPQRNIALSLFLGTLMVTVIYLLANLMYVYVMPMADIAASPKDRVGLSAASQIFGSSGGTLFIAILIMVSTFGCNNGLILSGARVYYTMAKDRLFFPQAGDLNQSGVPAWGLWVQCLWACGLCLTGRYGDLLDMITVVVLVFYMLTIFGLYRLRKTRPDADRPYKAVGYPVLPAIYIFLAGFICVCLLIYKPMYTWPGLAIVALGVPIYFLIGKGQGDDNRLEN
jgi:basic amino acid/polyamine antiporter, APA family